MAEHGVDSAFLQHFVGQVDSEEAGNRDERFGGGGRGPSCACPPPPFLSSPLLTAHRYDVSSVATADIVHIVACATWRTSSATSASSTCPHIYGSTAPRRRRVEPRPRGLARVACDRAHVVQRGRPQSVRLRGRSGALAHAGCRRRAWRRRVGAAPSTPCRRCTFLRQVHAPPCDDSPLPDQHHVAGHLVAHLLHCAGLTGQHSQRRRFQRG